MGERKRMQSNRESARRSQMKKQKQLEDLTNEISRLQSANSLLVQNIKEKEDRTMKSNPTTPSLGRRLWNCSKIAFRIRCLRSLKRSSGSVEIPEIPDLS
ncbi:hypothetical protein K1719_045092 [Acacia pycnantha]|nr:hypothetical protein K1719_045092 [Acacia pycnantha]